MPRFVVLGSGVVGLSTAMMLARQGHSVTVFERDCEPVPVSPEDAWHAWERRGVAQFRQPHFLHAAARHILDAHVPEVKAALLDAGCVTFNMCTLLPGFVAHRAPREGDERFVTVTGRRPIVEYAFARAAERLVRVVRGSSISGLLTDPSAANGIPHITGVRTTDGETVTADLVVDAMGRSSKLPDWLEAIGARHPLEEAEESGFIYYTRYFRSTTGALPSWRAGIITHYHSFSLLTLPCGSQTWSVTIYILAGDPPLKALRQTPKWTALVGACPLHAHWLDGNRSRMCWRWAASPIAAGGSSWMAPQ